MSMISKVPPNCNVSYLRSCYKFILYCIFSVRPLNLGNNFNFVQTKRLIWVYEHICLCNWFRIFDRRPIKIHVILYLLRQASKFETRFGTDTHGKIKIIIQKFSRSLNQIRKSTLLKTNNTTLKML